MSENGRLYFETYQNDSNTEWVLFVHGAGGSTRTWKRQVEDIGAQYNLLIIDLPGHGKNAGHSHIYPDYTFEFLANKIWEVVDYLKIPSIHIVGISLGTIICLEIREVRPQSVLSVIMPGAIVRLNTKLKVLANLSLAIAKVIGYANFYKMSARIMMPRNNHKKSRDVFIKESKALTTDEFRKWTALYYGLNKTLNQLFKAKSDIPHLLVMGDQDHLFLHPAQKYADLHDNASIHVAPKCGHVVSIEKAAIFNEVCLKFLNRTGC